MTCSKGKSWQAQEDTTEGSSPNGPLLLLGSLQAYLPPTLNLDGFSLSLFLPRTVPSLSLSQAIPHTWVTQISGLSDMWDHPPTLHHQCARILVQQWLVSNRREAPYAVMTCLPHLPCFLLICLNIQQESYLYREYQLRPSLMCYIRHCRACSCIFICTATHNMVKGLCFFSL